MASSTIIKRWLRPEVYPLFAAVGVAVGICGMQLIRNISTNPEVRVDEKQSGRCARQPCGRGEICSTCCEEVCAK